MLILSLAQGYEPEEIVSTRFTGLERGPPSRCGLGAAPGMRSARASRRPCPTASRSIDPRMVAIRGVNLLRRSVPTAGDVLVGRSGGGPDGLARQGNGGWLAPKAIGVASVPGVHHLGDNHCGAGT